MLNPMIGKCFWTGLICLAFSAAVAGAPADAIRAAQTDLRVFCPAAGERDIQWSALLYLNQTAGAEVYIALFHPSPVFTIDLTSSADGQFHLANIGRPETITESALVDSLTARLFPDRTFDLVVCGADNPVDSARIVSLALPRENTGAVDSAALFRVRRVFFCGPANSGKADIILDDQELFSKFDARVSELDRTFGPGGPRSYRAGQLRRYVRIPLSATDTGRVEGFASGLDLFRLPDLVTRMPVDSSVRRDILAGLDRSRSYLRAAVNQADFSSRQIQLLAAAARESGRVSGLIDSLSAGENGSLVFRIAKLHTAKVNRALLESLGLDWNSRLEMVKTPTGNIAKLMLDMRVTGESPIDLSSLLLNLPGRPAAAIDTISVTILPHQRFRREFPIQWNRIDSLNAPTDSLRFTAQVSVGGVPLDLDVPLHQYAETDLGMAFLPGYTFLSPFTENDVTALAQPFEWQLRITKPYRSELNGKLIIEVPDGIVVGSFDPNVAMPEGMTAKYINLYLGAGRSMRTEVKTVRASLEVGGQLVSEAFAPVRVVRCAIPSTLNIAFVPDPEGRLEDFLRMAKAPATPLTPHGLMLANLEKFDLIIIGPNPVSYHDTFGEVRPRMREYVKNGGKILILGQSFGLSDDIYDFSINAAYTESPPSPKVTTPGHPLLKTPYSVDPGSLDSLMGEVGFGWPARVSGGTELVSAGELGSYLTVVTAGDGDVVYCGLPLLEMAARLDLEAIHLLANLIDFGHGE
jgi:hypothetical protein